MRELLHGSVFFVRGDWLQRLSERILWGRDTKCSLHSVCSWYLFDCKFSDVVSNLRKLCCCKIFEPRGKLLLELCGGHLSSKYRVVSLHAVSKRVLFSRRIVRLFRLCFWNFHR